MVSARQWPRIQIYDYTRPDRVGNSHGIWLWWTGPQTTQRRDQVEIGNNERGSHADIQFPQRIENGMRERSCSFLQTWMDRSTPKYTNMMHLFTGIAVINVPRPAAGSTPARSYLFAGEDGGSIFFTLDKSCKTTKREYAACSNTTRTKTEPLPGRKTAGWGWVTSTSAKSRI